MIRVRVEIENEEDLVVLAVQAHSIGQALKMAGEIFPGGELRVAFPLNPDGFFVRDSSSAGPVYAEVLDRKGG